MADKPQMHSVKPKELGTLIRRAIYGRDILGATFLISQLQANSEVTAEELNFIQLKAASEGALQNVSDYIGTKKEDTPAEISMRARAVQILKWLSTNTTLLPLMCQTAEVLSAVTSLLKDLTDHIKEASSGIMELGDEDDEAKIIDFTGSLGTTYLSLGMSIISTLVDCMSEDVIKTVDFEIPAKILCKLVTFNNVSALKSLVEVSGRSELADDMTQAGIVAKLVAILKMIVQEYGTEGPDASAIPIITAVFESLLMIVSVRPKIILGDEQFIHCTEVLRSWDQKLLILSDHLGKMAVTEASNFDLKTCANHTCYEFSKDGSFQLCDSCKSVAYCSKSCQKAHWPSHREFCKSSKK